MQLEVKFAGFGGQGVMLAGKLLAEAAMEEGKHVVWLPSYGPEMRGGTAYCTVVIADRPVGSPVINTPGNLVAMNRPSLEKFAPMIKSGGICVVNSSLIPITSGRADLIEVLVPCNTIANQMNNPRGPNMVVLAHLQGFRSACNWKRSSISFATNSPPKRNSSIRISRSFIAVPKSLAAKKPVSRRRWSHEQCLARDSASGSRFLQTWNAFSPSIRGKRPA